MSRFEFATSTIAFVGVLLLGILKGVLLAAVVSILLLLRRAARLHVAFLGRIPGTNRYSDLERNPDNERVPGADVAGARMHREKLHEELAAAGIALRLAEARSGVRDILRAEGLEDRVGYFGCRVSVDDVLESFSAARPFARRRSGVCGPQCLV